MGWLSAAHKQIPAASVAKERLPPVDDQQAPAEMENARLTSENDCLRAENESLKQLVAALTKKASFVEDSGVLWKRGTDHKVSPIAYCPECLSAMHVSPPSSLLGTVTCSHCELKAPFKPAELNRIAERLSGTGH